MLNYIMYWEMASLSSVQFSRSVVSDSLRNHEQQHTRPPCPSPTPRVHWDSRPSSQWCHPAISSSVVPFSSCPQSLPALVFSNESTLRMRWPKYWSFSFSIIHSKEISGLISFRMDWLDLLAVQGTLKRLLQHHSSKASILQCSAFFRVQLTSIHDYWKSHSFDYLQWRRSQFDSRVGKICWRRDRLPTSVFLGFPCGLAGKESTFNAGALGSIPGLGRSPGEGTGYPLQYSWSSLVV